MNEFKKYVIERYNVIIVECGINIEEGIFFVFELSPQQQIRFCNFENYEIESFVIKAKMMLVDKKMIPLYNIRGTIKYLQGYLKLTGSYDFIDLMLYQLFLDNNQ